MEENLIKKYIYISSVQPLSRVQLFATLWSTGFPVHHQLPKLAQLMSIELVMPSNCLILCCPLLLLPLIFPSTRVFSNESVLHIRWPNYCSFSFNISLSNEYSGLISFRMDWLDLIAVWGTLKSLLQHHNSKASILRHSAFFMAQLSHPYMTSGKTIVLTGWTFVSKVFLCFKSYILCFISHICVQLLEKTIALTRRTFFSKVMSLLLVRCLGF